MGIILIANKQEKLRFPCIALDLCKTCIVIILSRSLVYKNNENHYPSDDNEVVADE
jgi:hypothetical protein